MNTAMTANAEILNDVSLDQVSGGGFWVEVGKEVLLQGAIAGAEWVYEQGKELVQNGLSAAKSLAEHQAAGVAGPY